MTCELDQSGPSPITFQSEEEEWVDCRIELRS
jgi:hypothetical protein